MISAAIVAVAPGHSSGGIFGYVVAGVVCLVAITTLIARRGRT